MTFALTEGAHVPVKPRVCLLFAHWPITDQKLWTESCRARGLFDPVGIGSTWSSSSRLKNGQGYGRWLSWLHTAGTCDPHQAPGERVTKSRVTAYVTDLQHSCAPYTVLCRIEELSNTLRVLAPECDFGWLLQLYRTLRSRVQPVRDKRAGLRLSDELVNVGQRLMTTAQQTPSWSPRRQAVAYRDGLMIALLAYRPVRKKNFASMRLGQHLVRTRAGWQLLFAAAETKNHLPYQAIVPVALEASLQLYLEQHRPILLRGESGGAAAEIDAVWVSEVGTHLEAGALSRRVSKATRVAFGTAVPAHWFRDAAATTIAITNPAFVRDAHLVLGHADLATTEKHYNQAQSLEASRRYHALLQDLRQTIVKTPDAEADAA